MNKLKPCPFCGKDGKLFSHVMSEEKTLWWVECHNSHCLARRAVCASEAEAVSMWNERR